jgi:kexin
MYLCRPNYRPELTWRDVQHLCVHTAQHINPEDPDWEVTASGRPYSYKYGYGSLDAWTFVELAKTWKLVKKQAWVDLPQIELNNPEITPKGVMTGGEFILPGGVKSSVNVNATYLAQNNFETLEHITVKVWITHPKRGEVEVDIVSPNGVRSVLGGARRFDEHATGYPGWQFMSVKHWCAQNLTFSPSWF